jgi:type II secretory pathway component PulF
MLATIMLFLSATLVPYLVGVLTKWFTNLAKTSDTFAASGNSVKRLVVVLISTILTAVFAWAGVTITGNPLHAGTTELSQLATALIGGLSALISAVYAMVSHNGDKVSAIQPTALKSFDY